MSRPAPQLAAIALLYLATIAAPATAQLGGLARKAKAAIGADKATAAAQNTPVAPATGPVKVKVADRIDAPALQLFADALKAERDWLEERARIRKGLRTREDYRSCSEQALQNSADGTRIMKMYTDAIASPENDGSAEFMTKLALRMKSEQDKVVFAKCGYDPSEYGPEPGPSALSRPSEDAAAQKVGLEPRRYAMLKERIAPFCAMDPAERGGGDVRVPGSGTGVFFVYERAEGELLAPRCQELLSAMRAVS